MTPSIREEDHAGKFFGTLITVEWIRVTLSAILAFVTIETVPSRINTV
jgi:hypothetical protein